MTRGVVFELERDTIRLFSQCAEESNANSAAACFGPAAVGDSAPGHS